MKLEVGKTYKTRDGGIATITSYSSGRGTYPFYGIIPGDAERPSWTAEGVYCLGKETHRDLVEVLGQRAPRPTPAMRQKAIFEAMDFCIGDKVVIKARIEKANDAQCGWSERMQSLMDDKAVGTVDRISKYVGDDIVVVTFPEFKGNGARNEWYFLPQCLEHYTPKPETLALNGVYDATVFPQQRTVAVGCQHIDIDKVREVLAVWEKLNQ